MLAHTQQHVAGPGGGHCEGGGRRAAGRSCAGRRLRGGAPTSGREGVLAGGCGERSEKGSGQGCQHTRSSALQDPAAETKEYYYGWDTDRQVAWRVEVAEAQAKKGAAVKESATELVEPTGRAQRPGSAGVRGRVGAKLRPRVSFEERMVSGWVGGWGENCGQASHRRSTWWLCGRTAQSGRSRI